MATAITNPAAQQKRWNTLRLLRAARFLILVLDALLLIAVMSATEAHRAALKTVGKDTVPSIISAQHIKSAMADMDADAANELLEPPGASSASLQAYEDRRVEAAGALIAAAENITFGDAERLPIQSLQVGLGNFERFVQKARDLHTGDNSGAVTAYRDGAGVMDTVLLPAADALDKANNDVLERTYRSEDFRSSGSRLFIILMMVITLGALGLAQTILSQRMHRTFNPLLLTATLLVLLATLFALHDLSKSHQSLRVAKEDAFTSIHALWRARATAYAANTDESRYLLDATHAADHQNSFLANAGALARQPAELDPAQLQAALREGHHVDGFSGYLADELNNVTFTGEREAALETLTAWQRYLAVDAQIRQLERTGQHKKAIELCIGSNPGQSDWAFQQFDEALGRTLAINQTAFDDAVSQGVSALRGLELETGVAALLVALLVVAGFAPRIREYQ